MEPAITEAIHQMEERSAVMIQSFSTRAAAQIFIQETSASLK